MATNSTATPVKLENKTVLLVAARKTMQRQGGSADTWVYTCPQCQKPKLYKLEEPVSGMVRTCTWNQCRAKWLVLEEPKKTWRPGEPILASYQGNADRKVSRGYRPKAAKPNGLLKGEVFQLSRDIDRLNQLEVVTLKASTHFLKEFMVGYDLLVTHVGEVLAERKK